MAEREKSALYPGATWAECIELIKKISSFNLKAVSYQELAKKYGLSSTTTKSFTAKIGAAKQFGLVTTAQGNTIQLTDASKKLLYPTGESVRGVELTCFAQAPLYSKLISKYDGMALPAQELLANILMNEYRITRSVKDSAAKCFLESAEQLELIKGGILCYTDAESEPEEPTAKQPVTEEYRNFLLNEARYSSLTRSFPERAEKLFSEAEVKSVERYEHLLRLKDLYAPKAD